MFSLVESQLVFITLSTYWFFALMFWLLKKVFNAKLVFLSQC